MRSNPYEELASTANDLTEAFVSLALWLSGLYAFCHFFGL